MPWPLLALGPIAGVASIMMGVANSRRIREEEQKQKELEESRKVEMHEQEAYASKGNHTLLQQLYDQGMYSNTPQSMRDRYVARAGTYANQQIALDADTASKAGYQPYFGSPQQMQQAMQMMGQPGAPQGMTPTPQPPSMMAQVLAAYDAAQAADEQHRIVIPSLTHATGSGRTTWQIADDGTVTARIFEIQPGGEEWGDYDLVERAALTVAPDGTHTLTQLDGCDIDDLDRACRVWRAVRDVILRPEPTELDFSPEIVHCTPRTPAEEVMIVINR